MNHAVVFLIAVALAGRELKSRALCLRAACPPIACSRYDIGGQTWRSVAPDVELCADSGCRHSGEGSEEFSWGAVAAVVVVRTHTLHGGQMDILVLNEASPA